MGNTLIRFPVERRKAFESGTSRTAGGTASIVILPVVRIERHEDSASTCETAAASASNRGRRRRGRH